MRTTNVKDLTVEGFLQYGTYAKLINPGSEKLGNCKVFPLEKNDRIHIEQ